MLQDPALAIHPPILYLGYGMIAVLYCFIAALLFEIKIAKGDLKLIYRISRYAFGYFTLGIALGSWWAYRELGWEVIGSGIL